MNEQAKPAAPREEAFGLNWVAVPATQLCVGDRIVVLKDKVTKQSKTTIKVTEVVFPAKGCCNVHVSTDDRRNIQCYDRIAQVEVRK